MKLLQKVPSLKSQWKSVSAFSYNILCKRATKMQIMLFLLAVRISPLMAANDGSTLKDGIGKFLGVLFAILFPLGVIIVTSGAWQKKKGNPDAMDSITAGFWIAGAGAIMGVLYAIMGLGDSVSETDSNWG